MKIIPHRQSLSHSCLAACFLMLHEAQAGILFTEQDEQRIIAEGAKRIYPFYVAGVTTEVAKKYRKKIKVYVDNKYFAKTLKTQFAKEKNIEVIHEPIRLELIKELLQNCPLICHIDDNSLEDYSHASHFVVLEKATKDTVSIIDPWEGKRRRISNKTLMQGIGDLKTHIKMCPLLFAIEN